MPPWVAVPDVHWLSAVQSVHEPSLLQYGEDVPGHAYVTPVPLSPVHAVHADAVPATAVQSGLTPVQAAHESPHVVDELQTVQPDELQTIASDTNEDSDGVG